ncbi:NF038104 family lipoprotein [Nitrosomonas sp. Is35]|uniref:NF038104 family lipoprotein n=1 Tax=Nitrosomonas sp. Is35 TaxID=3080534 RepID=UPI00294ABEB7|nr:NF038104 family lipoprotein [Nitrosomonas sp. Is35]MDV6347217.1 NF038104 family lipoprotein [Nitrosomonas sp. Is35]
MSSTSRLFIALLCLLHLTGCAVIAVADAVVTTAATAAKVTVKAVGAVADAVIPDSKEKEKNTEPEK